MAAKARPLHSGNGSGSENQEQSDKNVRPTQADSNGDLIDLTRPLEKDTDLRLLTDRDPEALEVYRHSSAHLLAAAVLELFPETKLGHGPPTETGFFYDFYRPTPFTPEDLREDREEDAGAGAAGHSLRARISAAQRRAGRSSRAKATS